MNDVKPWYLSKTVWGALVAILASIAHLSGIELQTADQTALVDLLVTLAGSVGGMLALYGRLAAKTEIDNGNTGAKKP